MTTAAKNSFCPAVEPLEDRLVPTVTWHQGPVLPNVHSENLYLGSDWRQAGPNQVARQLEVFGATLVNSSFMDVLKRSGYGVGRGMAYQGAILGFNIDKRFVLDDSVIQADVQYAIRTGLAAQPGPNSLYVVYVEPGVEILSGRQNSHSNFDGYHKAFWGKDAYGRWAVIPYAVVAYPGGPNSNPAREGYRSTFDFLTDVASHEMAEAITDPMPLSGWYDSAWGAQGEIGDLTVHYHQYLSGYYVQLESNPWHQPLIVSNGPVYYDGQPMSATGSATTAKAQGAPQSPSNAAIGIAIQELYHHRPKTGFLTDGLDS